MAPRENIVRPVSLTRLMIAFLAMLLPMYAQTTERSSRTIVLIGGVKSHGPGEHDFPNGIRLLKMLLESSPDIKRLPNIRVEAYPDGWPSDDAVLDHAATIVWYFDGLQGHPLLNERHRTHFKRLMEKGVGLVALHQASTLPPKDDSVDLSRWLGAARYGMFDRTTETAEFIPAKHPVTRGVHPFSYYDEFYPTVRFFSDDKRLTPILKPKLHIQFREGKTITTDKTTTPTVAWAFERPQGGRSFGFTGLHYLAAFDQPDLKKLLLNAIVWTAGFEVPEAGINSGTTQRSGETIYRQRCSVCHDHAQEQIPPKEFLASRTPDYIVKALTTGVMQGQAKGLSSAEVDAVARYLTSSSAVSKNNLPEMQEPDLRANMCTQAGRPITLDGSWSGFGPDLDNARFQPNPELQVVDIPRLKPKWTVAYPGGVAGGPPSVAGGRVFVGTAAGSVMSFDVETGCTYWATKPLEKVKTPISVAILPPNREQGSQSRAVAFFGDRKAVVHALNAETGETLWETKVDDDAFATISAAVTIYDGNLYVPVTSGEGAMGPRAEYSCCTFRGSMVALDADTGKIRWKSFTISEKPRPFKRNAAGTQMYGPAGVGIWAPPTVDPLRKVVYGATAESKTALSVDTADAMMAFDLKTGARVWSTQATANDNWIQGCEGTKPGANCPDPLGPDADFSTPAILYTLPRGKRLLIAGQKSGWVNAFDPDSGGKLVWRRNLAQDAAAAAGTVLRDRAQPGIVFGLAADRSKVYAAVADPDKTAGHIPLGVYALNPADGRILWHTPGEPVPSCAWGAKGCAGAQRTAVAAMPGAVFAGSSNGHIRAYAADSGSVLWDFDSARTYKAVNGVDAKGGSIEGVANAIAGRFLFLTSGIATYGGGHGNALIAFTVDGK